jgi:cytochrome c peroxidase
VRRRVSIAGGPERRHNSTTMGLVPLRHWLAFGAAFLGVLAAAVASPQTQVMFAPLPPEVLSPPASPATAARVELGRLLFWDPILSGAGDVACATCHHPEHGYADGLDLAIGVGGIGLGPARRLASAPHASLVKRNSQSVLNVAFNGWTDLRPLAPGAAPMFWDIRVRGLEAQALAPIDNPDEMRGQTIDISTGVVAAVARLASHSEYVGLFRDAFEDSEPVSAENMARALAAFERTLVTPYSPFDRYLRGDRAALREDQQRGMQQFIEAGCAECHAGPMFSDFKVHTLGTPHNPRLADTDSGVGGSYGFRTPTLRNLRWTAPYMHNGVFRTIDEVLQFYVDLQRDREGRARHPEVSQDMLAPLLFEGDPFADRRDIPAFLDALNDPAFDRRIPARVPSGLPVGGRIAAAP